MRKKRHKPIHPGEVLKLDLLDELGLSAYRLAKDIRVSPQHIGRILSGTRGITGEMALRLGRYFGMDPVFWVNLQAQYELESARDRMGVQIERMILPHKAA